MTWVASAIFCQGGDKYNVYTVTVVTGVIYNHLVWQTFISLIKGEITPQILLLMYIYIATVSAITVKVWNIVKAIIFT